MTPTHPTHIGYKAGHNDPRPLAWRKANPGGQHSSPQPRERRQPAQVACWHCGHLAASSPCQSCIGQQPPPPPPPKEPATIEMGPLPSPDHTCAPVTTPDQQCDPEPLPAAWATFQPDMSCYVVDPATMTAGNIDHPGLIWAISQGEISMHGSYWRSEYSGRIVATTQQSILQWMRARGGSGGLSNCRLITATIDLSIACMGEHTTIELIDYGSCDIPPTSTSQVGIAIAELGGAAC